jgi:HD-like signal output (HDOD) protein
MTPSTPGSLSAASAAAPLASAGGSRRFGRFVLQDLLGRSSTTMAWQAHDTRARHDVLLMLPRNAPDALAMPRWIEGARRTARLSHPRLVPVCDIGVEDRWPYVACDLAEGVNTLGRHVASLGTPPPMDVARWCSDALEGLAYAHEAGVAHGDLGLHSLAIDGSGRIAVWGFAAAAAETAAPGGATLDPTLLRAQRDEASVDVLHAGLILHNLLAGEPALGEADMHLCVARMDQEMVRLPWTLPHPVPEALRAIVNRATDKHLQRRYLSARGLLRALTGWQQAQADDKGGALALLIDRLVTVGHLPGRPGLAQRVVQLSRMESQRLNELADVVLQDPALAFELLRQVNAAQFAAHATRGVTTVRRAVQLFGVQGLRPVANGLRPWPGALSASAADALAASMREARVAAHVARALCPADMDGEEAFLLALLQSLGTLLVRYHFPDEAEQIHRLVDPEPGGARGMSEAAAACAVIGVELDALAMAVARHWGFDETVLHAMRRVSLEAPVRTPDHRVDTLRLLASAAVEAAAAMASREARGGAGAAALARVSQRYARALVLGQNELLNAVQQAQRSVDAALRPLDAAA